MKPAEISKHLAIHVMGWIEHLPIIGAIEYCKPDVKTKGLTGKVVALSMAICLAAMKASGVTL